MENELEHTDSTDNFIPSAEAIGKSIFADITNVLKINPSSLTYPFLRQLTEKPARKFAEILLRIDRSLAEGDIRKSSRIALDYFTDGQEFIGEAQIPKDGPLLVVANHPGSADSIGAFSCVCREDSRIVSGRRPMLQVLPHVSRHLIYLEEDVVGRMGDIRNIINLLKKGESVILFPRGSLEPDPALLPGGLKSIQNWSQSVGLFLAKVPETKLMPLLISQTVAPKAWKSLLVTWSKIPKRRHQIAMILQFAMQRVKSGKGWKVPIRIEAGIPYDPRDLSNTLDPREINESVQRVMSEMLVSAYPDMV